MIPGLKCRLLTRRCNVKVRLAHLLEIVPSGIHAHFVARKTDDTSSLVHHVRLGLRILVSVIRVLLTRKIQHHHLFLIVHIHAVVMIQLLVFYVSLQVCYTVSAAHDAILIVMRRRLLLVHGRLAIVDHIT